MQICAVDQGYEMPPTKLGLQRNVEGSEFSRPVTHHLGERSRRQTDPCGWAKGRSGSILNVQVEDRVVILRGVA